MASHKNAALSHDRQRRRGENHYLWRTRICPPPAASTRKLADLFYRSCAFARRFIRPESRPRTEICPQRQASCGRGGRFHSRIRDVESESKADHLAITRNGTRRSAR